MTKLKTIILSVFLIHFYCAKSQNINALKNEINQLIKNKNSTVGVAIRDDDGNEVLSINGNSKFPFQSVFKYHIGLKVLHDIDKGKFSFDQGIKISKEDVTHDLFSPIRDRYPNGTVMKLSDVIKYTVSQSDNTGCDVLLNLIGGTKELEDYFKSLGITDMEINYNERLQQSNWDLQFSNWITPRAANQSLYLFFKNSRGILSKKSYDLIWKEMRDTESGLNRLKAKLPPDVTVYHKTGSSGTNSDGITAAVNDIGVVTLSNGKNYFLSVFITSSTESIEVNERIIAEISKITYKYFNAL